MRKQEEEEKSPLSQMLFGLPFIAFGVFMGLLCCFDVWQWYTMKWWAETPARILEASLETHQSTDSEGHEIASYSVKTRYRYVYQGKEYTGTRLGIENGPDNVDSYHHVMAASLRDAQRDGKTVLCYVNPANPEKAVLDRMLRPSALLCKAIALSAFGGAGVIVFLSGFRKWRQNRRNGGSGADT